MKLTINNQEYELTDEQLINVDGNPFNLMELCISLGIDIPHLCKVEGHEARGACRLCVVELEGQRRPVPSCSVEPKEGMKVTTHSPKIINERRTNASLLISDHNKKCISCSESIHCELFKVCDDLGINVDDYTQLNDDHHRHMDFTASAYYRDNNICINCGKCVDICKNIQTVNCIEFQGRGIETNIKTAVPLCDSECSFCGQCVLHCPTGAIKEQIEIPRVLRAMQDPSKTVVVQVAPSIRVGIGEEFGLDAGTIATGKLVKALRLAGFDFVFDTQFGADLTIMEEGAELLFRLEKNENLPIITSCCPAWVKFCENHFPQMTKHLSSAKSPHMMLGSMLKNYFAPNQGIKSEDLIVVSVMPCIAKKFEIRREEMKDDVDYVLTTREFAMLLREKGINLAKLEEDDFDNPFGESTGAGAIFGASGGVQEAALRTVCALGKGESPKDLIFESIRGPKGRKDGKVKINGRTINYVAVSSLGEARKMMEEVLNEKKKTGKIKYDFIEVMACQGGCINGGGQPKPVTKAIVEKRRAAIYSVDKSKRLKMSHENPSIIKLYDDFLGKPLGENAHQYLHTTYVKRGLPWDEKNEKKR